jgi:hypothetical protein
MTQTLISSKSTFSIATVLWGAVGLILLTLGAVTGNYHLLLLSLPGFAMAGGLWMYKTVPIQMELTETSLRIIDPPQDIPYSSIKSIMLNDKPQIPSDSELQSGPLMIMHHNGFLEIPERLNVSVIVLYRFLMANLSESGSTEVNPQLRDYLSQEQSNYGTDKVWTYCARQHIGRRSSTGKQQACCLLMTAVGFVWMIAPVFIFPGRKDVFPVWLGFGIPLSLFSFLFWLLFKGKQRHPDGNIKNWPKASLIVGPSGIAMVQGDLVGKLRWDELSDVQLKPRNIRFAISGKDLAPGAIRLVVPGADIRIADIYDRPAPIIFSVIRRLWKC